MIHEVKCRTHLKSTRHKYRVTYGACSVIEEAHKHVRFLYPNRKVEYEFRIKQVLDSGI